MTGVMRPREHGTIVSWRFGIGSVRADNGDTLKLFYWSVLQGFANMKIGQRVEFSRGVGLNANIAGLVIARLN